uniref:Putative secreted protein n=1 Tax=Anopheles triannulatus TaxID=58253 RepID=A0A2M4B120_9DIPT
MLLLLLLLRGMVLRWMLICIGQWHPAAHQPQHQHRVNNGHPITPPKGRHRCDATGIRRHLAAAHSRQCKLRQGDRNSCHCTALCVVSTPQGSRPLSHSLCNAYVA